MHYKNIVYCSSIPLTAHSMTKIQVMNVFCENNINKIPALGEFPEELLVVKRSKNNGNNSWFLQNLSGEPIKLDCAFPESELFVVDPVSETAVFRGGAVIPLPLPNLFKQEAINLSCTLPIRRAIDMAKKDAPFGIGSIKIFK